MSINESVRICTERLERLKDLRSEQKRSKECGGLAMTSNQT